MHTRTLPFDPDAVQRRALAGLVAMAGRQALVHGATYAGTVVLAWWLAPAMFGAFAIAAGFVAFLGLVADLGLGAALVQRPAAPSDAELRALFTFQLALFGAVTAGIFPLAPWIVSTYGLPAGSAWPVRALALTFWSGAFRAPALLLLERRLEFGKIAVAEVAATLGYQGALLLGVGLGWGLWSLVGAGGLRSLVEIWLLTRRAAWRPRLGDRLVLMMPVLSFGARLQVIRLLAFAKDNVAILLVAPILGTASVGYLNWALLYVGIPVLFTNVVMRVTFPSVARVQDDRIALGGLLGLALRLTLELGLPVVATLALWAPALVPLVYGPAWSPGIPVAEALLVNMIGGLVLGVLFTVLYGTGQLGTALGLFSLWVAFTYAGAAVALWLDRGVVGIAWAYSLATLGTSIATVRSVGRRVPLSLWVAARPALAACWPLAAGGVAVRLGWLDQWVGLGLALLAWATAVFLREGRQLGTWVRELRSVQTNAK